ncbi:MAG TPA: polyhydroxyalkanoic acid system family protein [Sphingomonas sp.]|nr:polyhydroxyalkanoic acid system family protein [Sphingomonas sp.]
MGEPVEMDIPHKLGKAGVHARLDKGIGKIATMIPGGAVVEHRWDGDTMHFTVSAMGQRIASRLDTFDDKVHAVIDLPPLMALFANQVKAALEKEAPKLLE